MNTCLSIIVPIYNTEKYLHKCIDSILAQTYRNFELILVDDGSTDRCPEICDEYAARDNRVRVIHKRNGGYISARKSGISVSTGEYIGYVDSDDWIEPDMYEKLVNAALKYNVDIVICDVLHCYANYEQHSRQSIASGYYGKYSLEQNVYPVMLYYGGFYRFGIFPSLWNKIFKREIILANQDNIPETIRMGEDSMCTYPCLMDANSIYYLESEFLYHYNQVSAQSNSPYDPKYFDRIIILYRHLKEISHDKYDLSAQLNYYAAYLIQGAIVNEFRPKNPHSYDMASEHIARIIYNPEVEEIFNALSLKKLPFKSRLYLWLIKKKKSGLIYLTFKFSRSLRSGSVRKPD